MPSTTHPLDPLTPDEITKVEHNRAVWHFPELMLNQASKIVRSLFADRGLNFRVITLKEPPKDELITYLEHEHQRTEVSLGPNRCARVEILIKNDHDTNDLLELVINLDNESVCKQTHLEGKHSYIDSSFMKEVEESCMANARVQYEIQKLDLSPGASVIIEPWAYATDGSNDMSRRITMVSFNSQLIFLF